MTLRGRELVHMVLLPEPSCVVCRAGEAGPDVQSGGLTASVETPHRPLLSGPSHPLLPPPPRSPPLQQHHHHCCAKHDSLSAEESRPIPALTLDPPPHTPHSSELYIPHSWAFSKNLEPHLVLLPALSLCSTDS